jgi:hypothetical protein
MCTAAVMTAAFALQPATTAVAVAQAPSFRAAVDVVSVTAVVRDSRGRPVNNLGREDFQVYERGRLRQIVQFKATSPTGETRHAVDVFIVEGGLVQSLDIYYR